ncbi:hypothetical protein [Dickeya aquatica]|uniref:Uncharacterized protein n=1 Tax=Dickeya aquatica TaxID=1401087 RepID=A0A375AEI8_9GAMM|nr:hypothetical protein [Dickeya aquatica]SLM64009.1 hypothetical protein DAQ1742_03186 [Dickeya aquatica]
MLANDESLKNKGVNELLWEVWISGGMNSAGLEPDHALTVMAVAATVTHWKQLLTRR